MKTRTVLGVFLLALTCAWAATAALLRPASDAAWPWLLRQQALYLTGVWSIALMSLIMLLALRPTWLEDALGGMDKIYRLHKWSGILAIGAGAAHWLIKLASTPLKTLIGPDGRPARDAALAYLADSRGLAKSLGEWTLYALLGVLVITLWRRFPYHAWRLTHRAMPLAYLVLAFHTLTLTPAYYWTGPVGPLLLPLLAAGAYGALLSLTGRIGLGRRVAGRVAALAQRPGGVLEVTCELDPRWPGHQAGQFAFVTFERREGAHPFTIASAPDSGRRRVTFQIKALGNYTRKLAGTLEEGAPVTVEGPYGRFERRASPDAGPQVWVAGGIGVTPFLAWLDAARTAPADAPRVWLHYCVRDADADPFVEEVTRRCAALDHVTLQVHSAAAGQRLTADTLAQGSVAAGRAADVWYCGPAGLSKALRQGLRRLGRGAVRWHQEAFEMR